jgi:redox-sensitive bicupin YhaK (pirin superfamily)
MKNKQSRRKFVKNASLLLTGAVIAEKNALINTIIMTKKSIKKIAPLTLPWKTQDPFIFCSYHYDDYPGGNSQLGPDASLANHNIGQDFSSKDGWNMYHGTTVPGFPAHPHCGFETVSIVTKGMVDHSDSLGATGRFGNGDVQWLTSGKGVQHAEMFPLLNKDKNPFEIFQLWLNLPAKSKKVAPHYKMLWQEDIPIIQDKDSEGNRITVQLIAGEYKHKKALSPAPNSWAADADNQVQIWLITLAPNTTFRIDASDQKVTRSLYFYEGDTIVSDGEDISSGQLLELNHDIAFEMKNTGETAHFLFLQGKPIEESLSQHGPFVANSYQEIQEAIADYQQTEFGGWPWPEAGPVHDKDAGRFAIHSDGTKEYK